MDSDLSSGQRYPAFEQLEPEVEVSRVDEIAILSCVHEGMYDFVHRVSHEIAFNPPYESSAINGLQNTVSYFTVLCGMIKLRQNTIEG